MYVYVYKTHNKITNKNNNRENKRRKSAYRNALHSDEKPRAINLNQSPKKAICWLWSVVYSAHKSFKNYFIASKTKMKRNESIQMEYRRKKILWNCQAAKQKHYLQNTTNFFFNNMHECILLLGFKTYTSIQVIYFYQKCRSKATEMRNERKT